MHDLSIKMPMRYEYTVPFWCTAHVYSETVHGWAYFACPALLTIITSRLNITSTVHLPLWMHLCHALAPHHPPLPHFLYHHQSYTAWWNASTAASRMPSRQLLYIRNGIITFPGSSSASKSPTSAKLRQFRVSITTYHPSYTPFHRWGSCHHGLCWPPLPPIPKNIY